MQRTDVELPGYEGATLTARFFQRAGAEPPGSAILYIHGGGMVLGSMELYDKATATYAAETGVPVLSVDYRLAPEHPHPVPVEDCFAALTWLHEHAAGYGIDRARIAVMGDSAGGGLAAGTAILARDRRVPVARQILIYPMLDDRNVVPDPELVPFITWTYDSNMTGWGALLGERRGRDDVPARPRRPGSPTSAVWRRPTSRSASWISSATRTSSTRGGWVRPVCRPSCTCIPACRTASTPWPARPAPGSGRGRTGCGCCSRCSGQHAAGPSVVGLPAGRAHHDRHELDPGGHLVAGQAGPAVLAQHVRARRRVRPERDDRGHPLAEPLVRAPRPRPRPARPDAP